MAQTDLDWDHAADFGENDPLLEGSKIGHSTFYRSRTPVTLTQEELLELMSVLDTTRLKLQGYIDYNEEVRSAETIVVPGRCLRLRKDVFPKIARNIVLITIILQAFNILILSLIDIWPKKSDETVLIVSAATMMILQFLNLISLVYTSAVLGQQLFRRAVSTALLAQCYLATILLFAGIYILTFRLKKDSWKFVEEDLHGNPDIVVVLYVKLLFFSVSTATLCGTANVLPVIWYNYLFTSFQMLLSFVYFTSILGQSISQSRKDNSPRLRAPSASRQINNNYGSTNGFSNNILNNTLDSSGMDSSFRDNHLGENSVDNHSTNSGIDDRIPLLSEQQNRITSLN